MSLRRSIADEFQEFHVQSAQRIFGVVPRDVLEIETNEHVVHRDIGTRHVQLITVEHGR
jgi:hypothetical protein